MSNESQLFEVDDDGEPHFGDSTWLNGEKGEKCIWIKLSTKNLILKWQSEPQSDVTALDMNRLRRTRFITPDN